MPSAESARMQSAAAWLKIRLRATVTRRSRRKVSAKRVGRASSAICDSSGDRRWARAPGPGAGPVPTPHALVGTRGVIARLGARAQFADIDAETMNTDPGAAASRRGRRTKAVLVVHLFGHIAHVGGLSEACR